MEHTKSLKVTKNGTFEARQTMAFMLLLAILFFNPEVAHAGPIESSVDWVMELLTSGIARSVAIVACAVLGYMAWVGRLTAESAFKFIGGIVFVFGAAKIVDVLVAAVA